MKLLDFSNMKKVGSDAKTTTFKDGDGHEIKILHSALSKIHQEQIKRIPMHEKSLGLAKGGEVQNFDEGTPDEPIGSNESDESDESDDRIPASHDTHITINAAPAAVPSAAPSEAPTEPGSIPANVEQVPPVSVAPPTQALPGSVANPINAAHLPSQALGTAVQAANEKAQVEATKAQGMEPIYQEQAQNAQDIAERYNQSINDMKGHLDDFSQYMNENPRNSRRLLQDQTAEQKWETGIGIFLGGVGGSGTSNVALDYLNKAIDRDVADQESNRNQRKTIYGAYEHLYDDENIATNLTKASLGDKVIADANRLAAKLGTPEAMANRDALISQIQQQQYDQIQKAAFIANDPRRQSGASAGASPINGSSVTPAKAAPGSKIKYGPENADKTGVYNIQPMLKPGSSAKNSYLGRTSDPATVATYPRIQEQYTKTAKADAVLQQASGIYKDLISNATVGGWTGRHAAGGIGAATAAIPVIGAPLAGVIGAGTGLLGAGVTEARHLMGYDKAGGDEFEKERNYDTAKNKLGDLLRQAYPGIGGEEYNQKLSTIAPDQKDTPANVTKKMQTFEDLIKSATERNLLKDNGMAN